MATTASMRRNEIEEEEWQVRCDLAACYQVFVKYGWTDLIYTHVSARHPTQPDHYLINPYGLLFDEITASKLVVVDFEGKLVRGDYPYNDAGHAIHSAVLKARPDVNWVLHTHTRAGMAVACMKCGLLPLTQQGMMLHGHVSYHPYDLQTSGPEECERLAADLGPNNQAMILTNHGLLSCGPTVGEAFVVLYTLESACKVQVDVMTANAEIVLPEQSVVERMAELADTGWMSGEREWQAMIRWLERERPEFRT